MYFRDRNQAAELLSDKLETYRGQRPLVLGIPRGSVPMARILADRLGADLDVVLVHKIGAPSNPEFAIGSVSEFGELYQTQELELYDLSKRELQALAQEEVKELQARREVYSPVRPPIDPAGRIVIVVDDGIATGSTMLAAVRAIQFRNPKKVVVAAPVASPSAVDLLASEADEIVVLDTPQNFLSISQFYEDFPQVEDEEVYEILGRAERRTREAKRSAA